MSGRPGLWATRTFLAQQPAPRNTLAPTGGGSVAGINQFGRISLRATPFANLHRADGPDFRKQRGQNQRPDMRAIDPSLLQ
jgi:hypothetical protein